MKLDLRLYTMGLALLFASFLVALATSAIWASSTKAWDAHLTKSYLAGISLYDSLVRGSPLPRGITVTELSAQESALANQGAFFRLQESSAPGLTTYVSIKTYPDRLARGELTLGILSEDLRYPVSKLALNEGSSGPQKLGEVTRLLASYCSQPTVFARLGSGTWKRVDGSSVWGCAAAPRDMRLWALALALVSMAVLATLVLDVSSHFERFAQELRNRRGTNAPDSYDLQGPKELRDIVLGVNAHLEKEREHLLKRAMLLSGVSHDLGTPATRLRLRTALIKDRPLRKKLEADIDSMTSMIESVLTYAHTELNAEPPRQLSLTSLVEALVADYQDLDQPVVLREPVQPSGIGARSVFGSRQGTVTSPDAQRILVMARPISLKRGISNLIDNALKYGRRATIELSATPDYAVVTIEDAGSGTFAADVEAFVAPFKRGENTQAIGGFGLGLTIVSAVATQHGGQLEFENGQFGLRASLKIARTPMNGSS